MLDVILHPFTYVFNPEQRMFWGYLLSSLIIGWCVLSFQYKSIRNGFTQLWNKSIWLHPSTLTDIKFFIFNAITVPFVTRSFAVISLPITLFIYDQLTQLSQIRQANIELPASYIPWLFSITLFVFDDWSRYITHLLMHRIPWLWKLHKIHHSAKVLTPLTVYRLHPLESILYALRSTIVQAITMGLFMWLFGFRLTSAQLLGVNIFTALFNLAASNLRHSHIRLSYPVWIEKLFISPLQHQLHHSNQAEHTKKNYGSFLAIWDVIGQTISHNYRSNLTFGLKPTASKKLNKNNSHLD